MCEKLGAMSPAKQGGQRSAGEGMIGPQRLAACGWPCDLCERALANHHLLLQGYGTGLSTVLFQVLQAE